MAAISDAKRDEVLNLFDQGLSRNDIARRTGISAGSVTNICTAAGRAFDRSATKRASEARTIDLAAARLEFASEMSLAALELLRTRDKPYLVYAFGGRDNVYREHELARPPVEVVRNIVTTAGIAFDKATRVVENPIEDTAAVDSMLDELIVELGVKGPLDE